MDNFAQILRRKLTGNTSSSNIHIGGATLFKVQFNFDIPIFEGQIDTNFVDKWLNSLGGYFSVHDFFYCEKYYVFSPQIPPHAISRAGGKPIVSRTVRGKPHYFQPHQLGISSKMPSRNIITLSEIMKIST